MGSSIIRRFCMTAEVLRHFLHSNFVSVLSQLDLATLLQIDGTCVDTGFGVAARPVRQEATGASKM